MADTATFRLFLLTAFWFMPSGPITEAAWKMAGIAAAFTLLLHGFVTLVGIMAFCAGDWFGLIASLYPGVMVAWIAKRGLRRLQCWPA